MTDPILDSLAQLESELVAEGWTLIERDAKTILVERNGERRRYSVRVLRGFYVASYDPIPDPLDDTPDPGDPLDPETPAECCGWDLSSDWRQGWMTDCGETEWTRKPHWTHCPFCGRKIK